MKVFTIILTIIAIILIAINVTEVNTNAPFEGNSVIALITIIASACVILLLQILRISKRIEKISKKKA